MNSSKKALGGVTATMCLCAILGNKTAIAADMQVGIINVNNLNVRSENSTSSKVIGSLPLNTKVNIIESKNGWHKIDYNGKDAWVHGDYVDLDSKQNVENKTSVNKTGVVNVGSLNLRSGAGTSYGVIKTLPKDTSLLVLETQNNWSKVNVGGVVGYVSSEYITISSNQQGDNSSSNNTNNGQVNTSNGITSAPLNMRSGAGTNYAVIKVLPQGTNVKILSTTNGWYKIDVQGTQGYVSCDYVSTSGGNTSGGNQNNGGGSTSDSSLNGKVGKVTADQLNLRSGAGTNYNVVKVLTNGASVTVLESTNGWYKVNAGGTQGYVSAEYITFENAGNNGSGNGNNEESTMNTTGYVNADSLFVRKGPSTSQDHIGILNYNAKVNIVGKQAGWYKIKYNNGFGYISADYVTIGENNNGTAPDINIDTINKIGVVTATVLNVRSEASSNGKIVGTLRYGTKGNLVAHSNGWYKITASGITGWVHSDYIKIHDGSEDLGPIVQETELIDSRYTGTDIVNKAKEFIGTPYLWGGFTPVGFDCSGIVKYVYNHFGIEISRTTYYQVHEGKTVQRNELRAGDLIFFTTNEEDASDISHVGIYIGNNDFIHAPGPGQLVKVSSLSSSYYNEKYYVSKRIIK